MKTCRACKIEKPLDEFHKSSSSPDGRQYRCKPCSIAAARQRAIDNPEAARAADLKYRQSEKYKATRKARRDGPQGERIREQKSASWYRHHDANLEKLRARATDPEFRRKARERYDRWRKRDPSGNRRISLKSQYGLTLDQWDQMLVRQGGRCDICEEPTFDLTVDHCHATGKVRALLCHKCNRGLGHFDDDPDRMRAAVRYLAKHRKGVSLPKPRRPEPAYVDLMLFDDLGR